MKEDDGMSANDPPHACRWCGSLVSGDALWCDAMEIAMSVAQASAPRKCRLYSMVPIDAVTCARWEPRAKGGRVVDGQMRMAI